MTTQEGAVPAIWRVRGEERAGRTDVTKVRENQSYFYEHDVLDTHMMAAGILK